MVLSPIFCCRWATGHVARIPSTALKFPHNIINKGKATQGITWVMQGIAHLHRNGALAKSGMFSTRGIGGTKGTANRGLADFLLFKKECLGFALGRLPFNLGFSEGSWLSVAPAHLAEYDSHYLAQ